MFSRLLTLLKIQILATVVVLSGPALAGTPMPLERDQVEDYLRQTQIPETLYHWTTERHLQALEKSRMDSDALGLRPLVINPNGVLPIVVGTVPDLTYRSGIFATANPITGIGYNSSEIYARNDRVTGTPPLLLVLKIKKDARRAAVITDDFGTTKILGKPTRTDVIHHIYIDNMGVALQEWIILNPMVIESAIADPSVVRPILDSKLVEAQSGLIDGSMLERHSMMSTSEAARVVGRVLKVWDQNPSQLAGAVPSLFKAPAPRHPLCEIAF